MIGHDPRRLRAGVDIGGTKTLGVLLDETGEVLVSRRAASGFGAADVVRSAETVLGELAAEVGADAGALASIGIGIPGAVDAETGTVRQALNLGIERVELGAALRDRLGRAVHVENDVNAAAVGAAHGDVRSLAYLNLGTGLAAGLVLDGRLWRGARGAAGEIGHVPIDPTGPQCTCGQRGCLEVMASGSGIQRQWGPEPAPDAEGVLALAAAGDERASAIVERLVWAVASAVRLLVLADDVERVAIGGGLAGGFGAALTGAVDARLREWEAASPFLASLAPADRVVAVPRDRPIAAIGAALAAAPTEGGVLGGVVGAEVGHG